jgi:hypothetical protein
MLRATECLRADRLGLRPIAARALSIFSRVRTVLTLPEGFLFVAEAVVRNLCTDFLMVLPTVRCHPILKCRLNICCVGITESSFFKKFLRRTHGVQRITDPCLLIGVPSLTL